MMQNARYRIRDWAKLQHYKGRRPPWIKLYRELLDDIEWFKLKGEDAKILIGLWLIASDSNNGNLPDIRDIAFRLRTTETVVNQALERLASFVEPLPLATCYQDASNMLATCYQDASNMLASCYQDAIPETETERERETETETDKETETEYCPEPKGVGTGDDNKKYSISFPCTGKDGVWCPTTNFVEELQTAYPYINIVAEFKKARLWILANPGRKKTARGMTRFLASWIDRACNSGRYVRRNENETDQSAISDIVADSVKGVKDDTA